MNRPASSTLKQIGAGRDRARDRHRARARRASPLAAGRMAQAFWSLLGRFRDTQSGNYLITTALLMPMLIGCVGLAIDAGLWFEVQQVMQSAADAAAFSAATAVGNGDPVNEANAIAASYGFQNGVNGVMVLVNRPPKSGRRTTSTDAIEVVLQQPQSSVFSGLWLSKPTMVSARAVAVASAGYGCLVALDRNAGGAITVQGNPRVVLIGCSIYDNSADPAALIVGGSASIDALSVNVVGGISGATKITAVAGVRTGTTPLADPYGTLSLPGFDGCDQKGFVAKSVVLTSPGVYCGGMTLNGGAAVTLAPGVYYLDGGGLTIAGGASLTGNRVTLVFTSSSGTDWAKATINSDAVINLTAPTSGPTAGIVILGDRNMPLGTQFKLTGGSSQIFAGAIYLPRAAVTWAGGSNSSNKCTEVIVDTISFSGNSRLAVDCSGYGTAPIGAAAASLVE